MGVFSRGVPCSFSEAGEGSASNGEGECDRGYKKNIQKSNKAESNKALLKLIMTAGDIGSRQAGYESRQKEIVG